MNRRFEVTYYEYGLTNRIRRKFFTAFATLIYFTLVNLIHGKECYARIYEL